MCLVFCAPRGIFAARKLAVRCGQLHRSIAVLFSLQAIFRPAFPVLE